MVRNGDRGAAWVQAGIELGWAPCGGGMLAGGGIAWAYPTARTSHDHNVTVLRVQVAIAHP